MPQAAERGEPGLGTGTAAPLNVLGQFDLLRWGTFEAGFGFKI